MLLTFCEWLNETWVSVGIRESQWVYPMLHFAHILANTLMFGTIVFLDLRLIGVGLTRRRVSDVAEQLLPWTWAGWVLMFLSGAFIFTSDPVVYYHSFFFRIKMSLMLLAGVNALLFHFTIYRGVSAWDQGVAPARARMAGAISLVSWIAIVVTGRAVGYFDR
ncbi:MAG: DUF6644 family protein [Acidobacteriota bacterium]